MKKLWVVTIQKKAFVLADSAKEAMEQQDSIDEHDDWPEVGVELWVGQVLPRWEDNCFVYGTHQADITLSQAKRLVL